MTELPIDLRRARRLSQISIATSVTTWLCCTLPIILVALGLGSAVAALTSSFPLLTVLSEFRGPIFIGSGIVLIVAIFGYRRASQTCGTAARSAVDCTRTQNFTRALIWLSAGIWVAGIGVAYLALPLRLWLDG